MTLAKSAIRGKLFTKKNLQTLAKYDIETLYRCLFLGKEGGTAMWKIHHFCSVEGEKVYSLGLMTKHMADLMSSSFKDSCKVYPLNFTPLGNSKRQNNSWFLLFSANKMENPDIYRLATLSCYKDLELSNRLRYYIKNGCFLDSINPFDEIYERMIDTGTQKHHCFLDKNIIRYIGLTTIARAEIIVRENGFYNVKIYELDQSCLMQDDTTLKPNYFYDNIINTLSRELAKKKTQVNISQMKMCPYAVNIFEKRCRILAIIKRNEIEGMGLYQYQIAKMAHASTGLVSEIYTLYKCNNNLTEDDLWWSSLGRKPNNFSKISEEIYNELCELLNTKGPMEVGIPAFSWTAKAIIHFLKRYDINVTPSYIYRFCRKLHLTSKFATRKNPKQDDEKVLIFTTEGFKSICEIAKEERREIIFVDQCHVEVHHRFTGYSLANTPTICSYDASLAHSCLSICSFIGVNGYFRSFTIQGSFNSENLIKCLNTIKNENKGKKFIFIMDNSPVHTSNESFIWYMLHEKFCKVYYLPPYSPKLNVVEFYNNIFKTELKEIGLMTNSEMLERAESIVKKYNSNSTVTKDKILSLFSKKECSYIKTIYLQVNGSTKQDLLSAV